MWNKVDLGIKSEKSKWTLKIATDWDAASRLVNIYWCSEWKHFLLFSVLLSSGRSWDSADCIGLYSDWLATGWTEDGSVHTPGRDEVFLFSTSSRPGVKLPVRETHHLPLASAKIQEYVELYIHSPTHLLGVVLNWSSTRKTLPYLLVSSDHNSWII
jgi:hypothetical protein